MIDLNETKICSVSGDVITRDMVIGCISDTYKDINGFRPRWMKFSEMTFDELGNYLTKLQDEYDVHRKSEIIWEREERKERSRSEKRYQSIRKAAKSLPPQTTFSLGEILKGVI